MQTRLCLEGIIRKLINRIKLCTSTGSEASAPLQCGHLIGRQRGRRRGLEQVQQTRWSLLTEFSPGGFHYSSNTSAAPSEEHSLSKNKPFGSVPGAQEPTGVVK